MNKIELDLELTWNLWEQRRKQGNQIELDIWQTAIEFQWFLMSIKEYKDLRRKKDLFIKRY